MRTTAEQLTAVLDNWQSGSGPLYLQLSEAIISLAEAGSLEHGCKLPSERALADALHVSRNTVTAAYQHLRDEEWLDVRPGAAPTLGARARGLDAMDHADALALILPRSQAPIVGLTSACPPASPSVRDAFADPDAALGGTALSGNGYAALGDRGLIDAVVERLRLQGIDAEPDEVVITSGGQQALWLAINALACKECPMALESVTYPGVFDAVVASGARSLALPMTSDGVDVDASVRLLRAARPDVAYVTTFHNPTGTAMTEDGARRLLEAAATVGTTVIDDRITGDLVLQGDPRPPLASLGTGANVLTISGLSKIFWGGLRIGWIHTNATLAAHLRQRKAAMDLGSPSFLQGMAARLLTEHYDATLAWRLESLRDSLAAVTEAIDEADVGWRYRMPDGGPCLWVEVPGADAKRFAARAEAAGVPVAPGSAFEVTPGAGAHHFRLPFYLPPEDMRMAVKILAEKAA